MCVLFAFLLFTALLFGLGFALHVLWWIAVIFLIFWLIGLAFRPAEGAGTTGNAPAATRSAVGVRAGLAPILDAPGEVSEWLKVPLSKSGVVYSHRGFESHPLRAAMSRVIVRQHLPMPAQPPADRGPRWTAVDP